jgi:hypothetical protein
MIKHRNEIVHRIQAEPINNVIALNALDAGMAIIRHCMDCLLAKIKRPVDKSYSEDTTEG